MSEASTPFDYGTWVARARELTEAADAVPVGERTEARAAPLRKESARLTKEFAKSLGGFEHSRAVYSILDEYLGRAIIYLFPEESVRTAVEARAALGATYGASVRDFEDSVAVARADFAELLDEKVIE